MVYAGIGSRETPQEVLHLMSCFAGFVGSKGWHLRSGGAHGADYAFKQGCENGKGTADIYIPWDGYNGLRISDGDISIHAGVGSMALRHAQQYHPAWNRCSDAAKKLHARNSYIVLSNNLRSPVDIVICWTREGLGHGGTGQAVRIAKERGIPVVDLGSYLLPQAQKDALNALYKGRIPC